LSTLNNIYTTS
jgi:hypothetical protein